MLRSNNPVFTGDTFNKPMTWDQFQAGAPGRAGAPLTAARPTTMTITGTINATLILLAITAASAVGGWMWLVPNPRLIFPVWLGTILVGFFSYLAVSRMPKYAMFTAPVFAVVEGLFCGAVSVYWATKFGKNPAGPALVITAVLATFGVSGAMLVAYYFRVIRATPIFTRIVIAATGGFLLLCIAQLMLVLVFKTNIPYLWDGGPISIAFALFVIGLAAANLVLDFDYIERGVAQRLPRQYEWVGGFGLLVTLVWLYVSILRLLAYLRSND